MVNYLKYGISLKSLSCVVLRDFSVAELFVEVAKLKVVYEHIKNINYKKYEII